MGPGGGGWRELGGGSRPVSNLPGPREGWGVGSRAKACGSGGGPCGCGRRRGAGGGSAPWAADHPVHEGGAGLPGWPVPGAGPGWAGLVQGQAGTDPLGGDWGCQWDTAGPCPGPQPPLLSQLPPPRGLSWGRIGDGTQHSPPWRCLKAVARGVSGPLAAAGAPPLDPSARGSFKHRAPNNCWF